MTIGPLFGLDTLSRFLDRGLSELGGTFVRCLAYNASMKYVLKLFDIYPSLQGISIIANEERIEPDSERADDVISCISSGKIQLFHLSENVRIIHAKAYAIYKGDECILMGVGSPNLTNASNLNIELLVVFDKPISDPFLQIWDQAENISDRITKPQRTPPPFVLTPTVEQLFAIDPEISQGLWEHQNRILEWLTRRTTSIVNIPPGTGKTTIALSYARHLVQANRNLSIIVLVPNLTLLAQWIKLLPENGFQYFEGGTTSKTCEDFLAGPEGCVLVTLYSRFQDLWPEILSGLSLVGADCLLIADECHHIYGRLDSISNFSQNLRDNDLDYFHLGLSATIDSFNRKDMLAYIDYCGGIQNRFQISLPSFYNLWNSQNGNRPILKRIHYRPYFSRLTTSEMEEYNRLSRKIAIQSRNKDKISYSAAIQRAQKVRSSENGIRNLRRILDSSISRINQCPSLVFVQTNVIAEEIRDYITSQNDWDPKASAYVYDSKRTASYREYAMKKFSEKVGFCLIAEQMLAEGFDLPLIALILLHGSHRSERDWIQKVGRAIRYDPNNPDSIAAVIDIVFCDPDGAILPMEQERFETLSAISLSNGE